MGAQSVAVASRRPSPEREARMKEIFRKSIHGSLRMYDCTLNGHQPVYDWDRKDLKCRVCNIWVHSGEELGEGDV